MVKPSRRFISLYYILDFELYTDTLYSILQDDLDKVKDIRAWILNPHTFELFRQMIRDAMISAHLDLKAIHRDDWNTYVCNDRVIHTIQEWNSLIL